MSSLCHTHLHSENSILDGYSKVAEIPKIAKENGDEAVCLTDHGTLSASLKFWKACKEYEIKGVQGVETYFTEDISVKNKDSETFHLILLAKNQQGFNNLCALSRIGWTEGFYSKPRIDYRALQSHSEGLIATSACMGGIVANRIDKGNMQDAREALAKYKSIFKDDLYVELQPGNSEQLNWALAELADSLKIKTIVAVDSHYDKYESRANEELLLIMQQVSGFKDADKDYARLMFDQAKGETLMKRLNILWPNRKLRFDEHDLYIMDRAKVEQRMNNQDFDGKQLCDTTLEISEKCEQIEFETGRVLLPKVSPPDITSDEFLKTLVKKGLEDRGLFDNEDYRVRAKEELAILSEKGFSDYFLIVWDIIREARSRNIYVGPGRGSAAGSLVAYALKITSIDPVKNKLLFFRFIDPERADFPDIDMDFEHRRRDEMKEYMREKYGEALSLATFSEFKAKGLIRSMARAFAISLDEVDAACKHFDSLEEYEEHKASGEGGDGLTRFRAKYPEILPIAKQFEGHVSGTGMHAAGLVVADRPMDQIVPIETRVDPEDKTKRVQVAAYDMRDAEEVGLIKLDFLGLINLSIFHDCVDLIKERHGIDIDWEELDTDDPAVLNSFANANTVGVFQMESGVYRQLLLDLEVDNFEDLVASNALVRPGAYQTVAKDYIRRKKGLEKIAYPHEDIEDELSYTYGCVVYQEQQMQLSVKLGGLSWGQTNKLRKVIGKKLSVEEFAPYHDPWIEGVSSKIGIDQANKLWSDLEKWAGYGFNRSHAFCYSYIGWVCMWFKHYYALEYMYSLLKNEKNDMQRMTYLLEARRLGIKLLPPDINRSEEFTAVEDDAIRFGLSDVKQVGFSACTDILKKRPFYSWDDFNERVTKRSVNAKVVDALVAVDALAPLAGAPRPADPTENYMQYLSYPIALESVANLGFEFKPLSEVNEDEEDSGNFHLICGVTKDIKRTPKYVRIGIEDATGNVTVFGSMSNDLSNGEVVIALIGDKTMVGFSRVQGLKDRIDSFETTAFESFLLEESFKEVEGLRTWGIGKIGDDKALVVPLQVRSVTTKAGKKMAFCYLTDGETVVKVTIFPGPWEALQKVMFDWVPVCVKLSRLEDGGYTLWKDGAISAKQLLENKEKQLNG